MASTIYFTEEEKQNIIKMYSTEQKSIKTIADYFKVSSHPIKRILLEYNVTIRPRSQMKDEVGNKYGRLTVLKSAGIQNRVYMWECECDCINPETGKHPIKIVSGTDLRRGSVRSCGCLAKEAQFQFIDISGQKFGHLTALKPIKRENSTNYYWQCECDCKNKTLTVVNGSDLRKGNIISCGCIKSKGEDKIIKLLKENNITFICQKSFKDCFYADINHPLKFDFYILQDNQNYLIEFDGRQHFQYDLTGWNNKENYDKVLARDSIKNEYCKKNKIPLIRIPYFELENLQLKDLLLETTKYRVV